MAPLKVPVSQGAGGSRRGKGGRCFWGDTAPAPAAGRGMGPGPPRAASQTKGRRSVTPSTSQPCLGSGGGPQKGAFLPKFPLLAAAPPLPPLPWRRQSRARPRGRTGGGRRLRGSALPGGHGRSSGAGSRRWVRGWVRGWGWGWQTALVPGQQLRSGGLGGLRALPAPSPRLCGWEAVSECGHGSAGGRGREGEASGR